MPARIAVASGRLRVFFGFSAASTSWSVADLGEVVGRLVGVLIG